jgi:hypothetical protein
VLAKIAEMPDSDRIMAERVHAIVKANAPVLAPKLWYAMPAYAMDGKVVCFFQSAAKFKSRYATLGLAYSPPASSSDPRRSPSSAALSVAVPVVGTEVLRIRSGGHCDPLLQE